MRNKSQRDRQQGPLATQSALSSLLLLPHSGCEMHINCGIGVGGVLSSAFLIGWDPRRKSRFHPPPLLPLAECNGIGGRLQRRLTTGKLSAAGALPTRNSSLPYGPTGKRLGNREAQPAYFCGDPCVEARGYSFDPTVGFASPQNL